MYKLNFIDVSSYDYLIKKLNSHIANGNKGEFEIHLDSAYGSPYYAMKILEFAISKNIKLKTYSTGKILDGGVLLIFGCHNNIAYTCTELYISNKPLDIWVRDFYFKHCKYHSELCYVMSEESDHIIFDEEWQEKDRFINASELLEYGVFEEIRHIYKSSQHSISGIKVIKLDSKVNNGHICKCKKCKGKYHPVQPSEWCQCGMHDPFTFPRSECCDDMERVIEEGELEDDSYINDNF